MQEKEGEKEEGRAHPRPTIIHKIQIDYPDQKGKKGGSFLPPDRGKKKNGASTFFKGTEQQGGEL